jgi:curved DNA-binding protein CbpA
MAIRGTIDGRSLANLLREFYLARRTGVLEVVQPEAEYHFHVVQGDLHLSKGHPLATTLREFLRLQGIARRSYSSAIDSPPERAAALRLLGELVDRMTLALADVKTGAFMFSDDLAKLPVDLLGPFPTSYLIMALAVHELDEQQLLQHLGGLGRSLVANTQAPALSQMFSIDPSEMYLLSRAERPIAVGDLIQQLPGDRFKALRQIARLESVDLLQTAEKASDAHDLRAPQGDLLQSMVHRFRERIGQRLVKQPLELAPEQHRALLADLVARVGSMSHYELLGVGFHDDEDAVTRAYEELARKVHPDHLLRLNLKGRESAVNLLFERATLAYLTLADTERRAIYNQEAGIESSRPASEGERDVEQRAVARDHYQRAVELVENEDYHFALELVRQALRTEQRPEYFALLGKIQSKNPNWLGKAADSYRQAIHHDPNNPHYRVALGRLLARTGDSQRAKVHYRAALQQAPESREAIEALRELEGDRTLGSKSGWLIVEKIKKLLEPKTEETS